jgi:hypothetical protein
MNTRALNKELDMNIKQPNKLTKFVTAILVLQTALLPLGNVAQAAITDIRNIPLASFSNVHPV